MKKILLSILMLISLITMSFGQENKLDGKGLRKGDWLIMYKGEFLYSDYLDKLLNLDKMLVSERETESIDNSKYFEVVNYKKGVKYGEFHVYSSKKPHGGNYPLIAQGSYINGKISGIVFFFNYYSKETICAVEYKNGQMIDQTISINKTYGDKIFSSDSYFYQLRENYIKHQVIKIKNNVCLEQIGYDINPVKFVKTESGFTRYLYGVEVDNITSGLMPSDMKTLEVAHYNANWELNGVVTIFKGTRVPFDTTSTIYKKAPFQNGKLSGIVSLFNADGKLLMESNYKNGMLNGISKYYFADTGQLIAEATYKDGLLNGKFTTYHLNGWPGVTSRGPICESEVNKNLEKIFLSYASYNIFRITIPLFKKQGYKFNIEGDYKFFEANYVNGIMQGPLHYFHSNGKKLYEGNIENCEENEYAWFDMNGTKITNKQQESVKKYYIQWDMSYMNWQCTNPGCGKKEICPIPNNVKTNIPLPEHYWILETGLRPDNRCSKTIAYIDPVDWTVCNNRNFHQCNKKMVRTDKGKPVIEKFSTSDLLTFHLVKGYNDRLQEFLLAFSGKTTNTLLDLTAKGLDDYMSPIYGKDWRSDIRLRYNLNKK